MRTPNHRDRTVALAAALAAAAALTLTACGGSTDDKPVASVSASATSGGALPLTPPMTKPNLVLTDTHGQKFDFAKETAGKPVLLYFGYTHCPDVCPLIMSDIGNAKRKLPKDEQDKIQVIFVTTDPDRDTPQRLASWLPGQGQGFIGLTGSFDAIQAGAKSLGITVEKPVRQQDGSYTVTHSAEVLAFSPKDDKAHYAYTDSADSATYQRDIPKLIKGEDL
ncbi:SCO family protein [Streptantibioticus rubrisoli]|uniref:SCO family protein n=1 Tax=Streptantibioticus rubrisoli TaxID=1387313 RepID=A0ABT1PC72_9ACTN|nr:SCO family protein [Streptantibioticus rubrisoli]MCQ4042971.1 SCO family protein [Streptantibioticus rubrisoli]